MRFTQETLLVSRDAMLCRWANGSWHFEGL